MGIFKRKPGGTKFGNAIRGGLKKLKESGVLAAIPGVGGIIQNLPLGEGLFMKKGEDGSTEMDPERLAVEVGVQTGNGETTTTVSASSGDGFFSNFFTKIKEGSIAHIATAAGAVIGVIGGIWAAFFRNKSKKGKRY